MKNIAIILFVGTLSACASNPFSREPASTPELRTITERVIQWEDSPLHADKYMTAYYADLPVDKARSFPCTETLAMTENAKIVLIGDEHTNDEAVVLASEVLHRRVKSGERPVLVIEFVFHKYQSIIDEYLSGRISLATLRKRVKFDDFPWAWNWDDISRTLVIAKRLKLRVLSGEEGSNNMDTRDAFTAQVIDKDLKKHPGSRYVVIYGTAHLLGKDHLGDHLARLGHESVFTIINFLGRKTEAAVIASGDLEARCLTLRDGLIYRSRNSLTQNLRDWLDYLSSFGQQKIRKRFR